MLFGLDCKNLLGDAKFSQLRHFIAHAQAIDCDLPASAEQEVVDRWFMQKCLQLAKEAGHEFAEIPVASLVVRQREIVGVGINLTRTLLDPTAHAEVVALRNAGLYRQNYRLLDCDIYVTLEPCPMCAGAILQARCRRIIYGAADPKTGACGSRYHLFHDFPMNHQPEIIYGVCDDEIATSLTSFFNGLRQQHRNQKSEPSS